MPHWVVKGKFGQTLHLWGILPQDIEAFLPISKELTLLYQNCPILCVETDFSAYEKDIQRQMEVANLLLLKDEKTIETLLGKDLFTQSKALLEKNNHYLSIYPFYNATFWLKEVQETTSYHYLEENGLDTYFAKKAYEDKKSVLEAANTEKRYAQLNGLSDELKKALIENLLKENEAKNPTKQKALSAYRQGSMENLLPLTLPKNLSGTLLTEYQSSYLKNRISALASCTLQALEEKEDALLLFDLSLLFPGQDFFSLLESEGFKVEKATETT